MRNNEGADGKKELADVVLAMRRDLMGKKTKLTHEDIKFFYVVHDK